MKTLEKIVQEIENLAKGKKLNIWETNPGTSNPIALIGKGKKTVFFSIEDTKKVLKENLNLTEACETIYEASIKDASVGDYNTL